MSLDLQESDSPVLTFRKSAPSPLGGAAIEPHESRARLVLQDGTEVEGYSFGAHESIAGEVVFNTAMVGYPEALTDPSYRGQILVLTYPLIGNYGVPSETAVDEATGLPLFMESERVQIAGLIVSDYSHVHSHWNASMSLADWLRAHHVPAIFGVDTRFLAKRLREHGTMLGKIEQDGAAVEFDDPNSRNLVAEVSTPRVRVFNEGGSPRILAVDCGMKLNIVREFVGRGAQLTVVPFDFDFAADGVEFDGLFLSNGPGDPTMVPDTVSRVRAVLEREPAVPVFGICLGNQLLALAAGARTYKMKYGNRAANQPCVDLRTTKCYITPQNHGFAVDARSLPGDWRELFINANDHSNEGLIHTRKPFFSVQFHPEACGGPRDTAFLFDEFLHAIRGTGARITTVPAAMYDRPTLSKVLLIGSGGLSIGQAGEFDYSGSQAIKALKQEGLTVVLVNPNIATVQTSKGLADRVYFLPVTPDVVERVIARERPDGILVSMGGQTALNVGIELHRRGVLARFGVRVLGTPIESIVATEDREAFAGKLREIGESLALSLPATTVDEAVRAAADIGYPVLVRAAFALGGLGSGFADNEAELRDLARRAFASSDQILIDQDLRGWKEVEYEVVRDSKDNCVTVCNMENFDPLGIHTGDSIVVAPSQTLSNREYFMLRDTALKVVRHLGIVGECNIQYALNPHSEKYCIIEVNARLSRSSALASKATGYPLAYVAAKLSLGVDLVSIKNSVTRTTTACFEPALDYCVIKVPRWDLTKFVRVSEELGSCMKSVGEVMAIGRTFEEALQKAIRMVEPHMSGFVSTADFTAEDQIVRELQRPSHKRLFAIAAALENGFTVDRIHALSRIDHWFLHKLRHITECRSVLQATGALGALTAPALRHLKVVGFSDALIAKDLSTTALAVRRRRITLGITPVVKQIDTLAAEFPASTNYLYMTYSGIEDDVDFRDAGVMVLGCGPYRIGSSVEFDWCAVSAVRTLRHAGTKALMVNCNPETVSTDYDESDRLYFEELTLERVLDIYEKESCAGVMVSVGGQIPNNLAMPLHNQGVTILGTSPLAIDRAEDRNKFSAMLDSLGVDQPQWRALASMDDAERFAADVGFPVLIRPSYVLSGAAMNVALTLDELREHLARAKHVSAEHPVVVSKFIQHAKEIEFDAVADRGAIVNYAISEHVENAGVHSGDATLVLPAQKIYVETLKQVKRIARKIARALQITGPFNIQLMARDNDVKVIECNLRASRTFPFISKTFDFNFISLATKVMIGLPVRPHPISLMDIDFVGIKAPQFSFTRLHGADPQLGVEMASTGEVACFGKDKYEAFLKALLATNFKLPSKDKLILISLGQRHAKEEMDGTIEQLVALGHSIAATGGTADHLAALGIVGVRRVSKPNEDPTGDATPALDLIYDGSVDLVIDVPTGTSREEVTGGYLMRRAAVDQGVSLITNTKVAELFAQSLARVKDIEPVSMGEYYRMNAMEDE